MSYVLVCAVSHESRVGGFNEELVLVPIQVSALQGAASAAASLHEQVSFMPSQKNGQTY